MPSARLEELGWATTDKGEISLRRRLDPRLGEVHEVVLDDEYLMSSAFTVAERALADAGLGAHPAGPGDRLDVVVGGLGLGCTAAQALADPRVGRLVVVEALEAVVDWHRRRLLPDSAVLLDDPRCALVVDDVFGRFAAPDGLGAGGVDVVLLDVDHSPVHLLHPDHAPAYAVEGLARLAGQLRADGVFALWADLEPDPLFLGRLEEVFAAARADVVQFANPLTGGTGVATLYVAST